MPLSTVLGAQSLIKPGVCTTATRPASPYTGQLIYDTTLSQTLADNGSAWVNVGATAGGLVLISATTIGTTVSSVTVSSAFSATYDNYKIMISGGAGSTVADMRMQLGATTTGYEYQLGTFGTSGVFGDGSTSASGMMVGDCSTDMIYTVTEIVNPFLSKFTFAFSTAYDNTNNRTQQIGAITPNTTSYTAFTLFPTSGTLTGGTIRVYGYQNS